MAKWIKNTDTSSHIWVGQTVNAGTYYEIQSNEENKWANDSILLSAIGSGDAIVAKDDSGNNNITDINSAINYLKDQLPTHVKVDGQPPFAAKVLPNGKKLFSRVHGESYAVVTGSNTLDYSIPYPSIKFNELEIIGGEIGDWATLKILDDASGTYSTIANYELNKFGNTVYCSKDYYQRASNYDADLYYGMRIYIEFESISDKTIYINYIMHEVKD